MNTQNFVCVHVKKPEPVYEWWVQRRISAYRGLIRISRASTHRFYRISRCKKLDKLFKQVSKLYNFPETIYNELRVGFMAVDMSGIYTATPDSPIYGYESNEHYTRFDLCTEWEHKCTTSVISSTS